MYVIYGEENVYRMLLDTCNNQLRVFKIPQKVDDNLDVSEKGGEAEYRLICLSGYDFNTFTWST